MRTKRWQQHIQIGIHRMQADWSNVNGIDGKCIMKQLEKILMQEQCYQSVKNY